MRALSPRSELRDIVWPGLPAEPGARLLAMQFQYAESERWAPEDIQAQQFRQLELLVAHCDRTIPFYRERLRRAGLRAGQKLSPALWSRLPVLTRAEAEAAGKRLHAGKIPQSHGGVVTRAIAGATGKKLDFFQSELAHFFQLSQELRGALWHDTALGEKLAVIEAKILVPPPHIADWGPGFSAVFATGPAVRLDIGQPAAAQAAWLIAEQPAYLRTSAANAALLARYFVGQGLRLPALRALHITGQILSPEQRALCQAAFGVDGIDAYSADDAGVMALRCPLHAHHHVASESVLLEVLDDRGKNCVPGEAGRVVVTPLHNFATPLLRYATGDFSRLGPPCSCGRTLPVLTQISERAEDFLPLPDAAFHGAPQETRKPNGTPVRIPRSGVSDLRWPALPMGTAARMLALQYQFSRTERWAPEELLAHQFAQLDQLVAHCDRTMPFYRARLREAGIAPGEKLTPANWARIPVLSRAAAQEAGTALHCLSVPAAHGALHRSGTSGSTGVPLSIVKTDLHQLFWDAFLLRDVLWHRLELKGKWAVLRRDLLGARGPGGELRAADTALRRLPDLGPSISGVFATGPLSLFEVRRPIAEQAAWLAREEPDYLLSFASNMALLAQHFRDTGQRLKRLRALRSFAEAVSEDQRDLCRDVFGVEILDAYSAEEIGYLALQCPDGHTHLHVMSEGVFLEVLDDREKPCAPGGIGRVVATPLHNFAMPLLRYEVGDYAEMGAPCPCGRGLPVLNRIIGRIRHGVLMPDGETRAARFGVTFYKIAAIRQYQAVQTARDTIEIRLVARRELTAAEAAEITRLVHNDLDPRFRVRFVYVDAIPRLASGKYEEFRCEVV
jgi:phenylacetate-CoA ligase